LKKQSKSLWRKAMKNLRKHFFYSDCHESPGGLKLWVAVVLMTTLVLACGYLEGIDQAIYAPK
jgi:tRNA G37 N-methylase TrmD